MSVLALASSFNVGGDVAIFDVSPDGYSHDFKPGNEISMTLHVDSEDTLTTLQGQRSEANARPIPGGTVVYVDVTWGPGEGTLVVDTKGTYSAILTDAKVNAPFGGSGLSQVTARFLITG